MAAKVGISSITYGIGVQNRYSALLDVEDAITIQSTGQVAKSTTNNHKCALQNLSNKNSKQAGATIKDGSSHKAHKDTRISLAPNTKHQQTDQRAFKRQTPANGSNKDDRNTNIDNAIVANRDRNTRNVNSNGPRSTHKVGTQELGSSQQRSNYRRPPRTNDATDVHSADEKARGYQRRNADGRYRKDRRQQTSVDGDQQTSTDLGAQNTADNRSHKPAQHRARNSDQTGSNPRQHRNGRFGSGRRDGQSEDGRHNNNEDGQQRDGERSQRGAYVGRNAHRGQRNFIANSDRQLDRRDDPAKLARIPNISDDSDFPSLG